jgi:hypothetical protein
MRISYVQILIISFLLVIGGIIYFRFILSSNPGNQINSHSPVVSQENAAALVQALPEVKSFLHTAQAGKIALQGESGDKRSWIIHVYEDLPDHLATFAWFQVDKTTGKITKTSQ